MIQHDPIEVRSENTQYNRLFVIDERGRKCYAHSGQRHCLSKFHMQIFIHDLRHNIQTAGRRIPVK